MPYNKIDAAQQIYVNEIGKVKENSDKWKDFLDFAAKTNLSDSSGMSEFSSKLIIHSYNPNAIDCRTFDEWKQQKDNHVNYREKGIPVLSRDRNGKVTVTHVFDTNQTAQKNIPVKPMLNEQEKQRVKVILNNEIQRFNQNFKLSPECKRLFAETAEYKLSKQFEIDTNENADRFSGIEKLSVKEIAIIGIALNGCTRSANEQIKNNDRRMENDHRRINHNQPRNDRTELHGQQRRGMDMGAANTVAHNEVPIRRESANMVQAQRGASDIRTADRNTNAQTNSGNGQIRQSEAEIHMADPVPDRSNNAKWKRGKALRGDERNSSEPDRRNGGEKETNSRISETGAIGRVPAESTDVGTVQNGSGRTDTSGNGLQDIKDNAAEPDTVSAVSLSQSEFIEIVTDILSEDEVVYNAHHYSDKQSYREEINSGIDEVFTEAISGKRDIGYDTSEMADLWNSYQNDDNVKKYIQEIVAENVDIAFTSETKQNNIEQAEMAVNEDNSLFSSEEEIIANQLSFEDFTENEPVAALTEDEPVGTSFDDEISSVVNERNLEVLQNIEVGDEITLKGRAYTVDSIKDDFMMSMTPQDSSAQEYAKSYIGNWREQLVEEAEDTPIFVIKPEKEMNIEQENPNYAKSDVPKEKSDNEVIQNAENKIQEDLLNALENNLNKIHSSLSNAANSLVQDLKNGSISPIKAIDSMREMGFSFNDTEITFNSQTEKAAPEHIETNNQDKQADTVEVKSEAPESKSSYFRITDEHLGEGSKREKFQKNIEAISTLKQIEREERSATPEEQEIMSGYIGWGGLQEAFDKKDSAWEKEYHQLKNLLTEDEYEAALSTVNDAFYTSPVITQAIYEGLENIGFNGGEILEPSMGVGNFFGTMPDKMRDNSNLSGVEIDSISGRIAQQLYPEANIAINGFEKVKLNKGSFDAAIGNVPFGNHGVNDKNKAYNGLLIHDYFFAKSIDTVRSGGVVAFVTSSGTLDKEDTKVRQALAQKAELLGAVRLPNNAFQKNAGTQTTTDIIFLKKRDKELKISEMSKDKSCDWVYTKENADGYKINSYFVDNPDMVLGKLSDNGRFGSIVCNPIQGADLKEQLHTAMKNIKGEYKPLEFQQELDEHNTEKYLTATPDVENLTYTVVNDRLYFRVEDNLIPLKESEQHGVLAERRKAMCGLGETTRNLLKAQVENRPDEEIKKLQSELNAKYDSFAKKYGRINPVETPNERNATGVTRKMPNVTAFKNDVRLPLLQSLEKMQNGQFIGKTEIFNERTIRPRQLAEHVETAQDALILSMSEKGKIDFDYMEKLTGFEKDKLIDDLHGDIYPVPELSTLDNTVYQTSDEYLSGNIYKKIDEAEAKLADNPAYADNIEALKQIIPTPLKATEIDMQLGMTWIDPKVIQQFMYDTFETTSSLREYDSNALYPNKNAITVEFSGSGKGSWKINNAGLDRSVKATKNFGTKELNAYEILEKILNSKPVAITETYKDSETGKNKTVIREKETKAAEDKAKQIDAAFKKWVFADPDRRNELVKTYNKKFNCIRPREYDGSNLNFFGSNPQITLKPHQKNAVAHALFGGNTLFAHQVGAGKTFEMIATAMEGKRLGLHNKSMFVVPNHLTEQIGSDFMKLYPNANILVAKPDDFSPQKRRQMCARIATGNFDAVVIGHSQLIKIPLSPKREEEFIRKQIKEVTLSLEAAQETDSKSYTVKQLEQTKNVCVTALKS